MHVLIWPSMTWSQQKACYTHAPKHKSSEIISSKWMNWTQRFTGYMITESFANAHMHADVCGTHTCRAKQQGRANSGWQRACLRKLLFLLEISRSPSPFLPLRLSCHSACIALKHAALTKHQHLVYQSVLPSHPISLIFTLPRFMIRCNHTNRAATRVGTKLGWWERGRSGAGKLYHCPSYFSTEASHDITTALLSDLSVAILQH